jgi:hypothetical protein
LQENLIAETVIDAINKKITEKYVTTVQGGPVLSLNDGK